MLEKNIALLNLYKQSLDFAHWKNAEDYAKHLLFDRLRKEISSQIDIYVERQLFDKEINFESYRSEEIIALQNYSGIGKQDLHELVSFIYQNIDDDEDMKNLLKQHLYLLK